MMKVISTTLAILLLSYQYPECQALINPSSVLEHVKNIDETSGQLKEKLISKLKTADEFEDKIMEMNEKLGYDVYEILDAIHDFLGKVDLKSDEDDHTLNNHFFKIQEVFKQAIRTQRRINDGQVSLNNNFYETFEQNNGPYIDKAISEIRRILTNKVIGLHLQERLREDLKESGKLCETGMKHLQFLNTLLKSVRKVSAAYYVARSLMYSFLEVKGQDRKEETKNLLEDEEAKFKDVVQFFKDIIKQAPQELWKCDPKEDLKELLRVAN